MLVNVLAALGALTGVNAGQYDAFWVVSHAPLMTTRLDPIVNPGTVGGHMHAIVGASSFKPVYTYENLVNARCTTANVAVDKSNYWVPQLYRKGPDGGLTIAPLQYANTYYQVRRTGTEDVYEFPPGFRMLAGNPFRTTFNKSDPNQDAVRYTCLNYNAPPLPETNGFPTYNCPDGLRAQVYFPHCWDGVNNWLPGSKHVSYGEGQFDQGGKCPDTHPKRIIGLFYEFIFKDDYAYVPGARVWASGDDTGYGMHGDFTNGWPLGLFQQIFAHGADCSNGFQLEKCPPLAPYATRNGSACTPDTFIVDEDIGDGAPLQSLPGNNPLFGASVPRVPIPGYVEDKKIVSVVPGVPNNWNRVGCIAEGKGGRALTAARTVDANMTPEKCISFCAAGGYSLAGIEYSTECYCGNSFSNGASSTVIDQATCNMVCPGEKYGKGYCGGPSALTLYKFAGTGQPTVGSSGAKKVITPPTVVPPTAIPADQRDVRRDQLPTGNQKVGLQGPAPPPFTFDTVGTYNDDFIGGAGSIYFDSTTPSTPVATVIPSTTTSATTAPASTTTTAASTTAATTVSTVTVTARLL